jgi:hypothetical protein
MGKTLTIQTAPGQRLWHNLVLAQKVKIRGLQSSPQVTDFTEAKNLSE